MRIITTGIGLVAGSFRLSRLSQKMHLNLTIFAVEANGRKVRNVILHFEREKGEGEGGIIGGMRVWDVGEGENGVVG